MATENPTTLRGILVPDHRITSARLWAAESDYTEAGAEPGIAEPQQDTAMELVTSGSQSSGGALRVRSTSAGFPERDGARFAWQQDGDTDWRGWDPPAAISSFENIAWPAAASLEYRHPHCVALDSGVVLASSCANVGAGTNVRIHSRSAAGVWASPSSIYTESPDGTNEHHPVLVVLPSGRVLCMFAVYDGAANLAQVKVYSSDDDGATWTLYQSAALRESIDTSTYTIERIRAAYSASTGQVAMVLETSHATLRNALWWYASADQGARFALVEAQDGGAGTLTRTGARHDVVAVDAGFLLIYSWDEAGFEDVIAARITPNAYTSPWADGITWDGRLDSAGSGALPFVAADVTAVEPTVVRADDGAVYALAVGRPASSAKTPSGLAAVSYDGGLSWSRLGVDTAASTDGRWFWPAATGTAHPERFHACWHRGRVVLAHNADDAYGATVDPDALWCAYLGGYTTAELPSLDAFSDTTNSLSWFWGWHPYEMPTAVGATAVGAATSEVLDSELTVSVAAAGTRYYRGSLVTGMTIANGMMAECEFSTTDNVPVGLRIRISDNVNDYHADIQVKNTSVEVYDLHAASQIGSTETVSSGDRVTVRIAVAAGRVWAGFKVDGQGEDRDWTVIANGATLTDNGAGAGVLYWAESGRTIADPKVSTFKWYSGRVTRADDVGALAEGFTNPDDLRGRPYSGEPVYVDDGTRIAALTGPTARGDDWHVDVRHRYGIENLHPWEHDSPRRPWRSVAATDSMDIAWKLSDYDQTDHAFQSNLFAIYLDGINFPTARISVADAVLGPTWATVADLDFRESLAFEREGSIVVPVTTGTTTEGPYVHRDELVGGWFEFANGDVRPIVANSEGHLQTGVATTKRAHIVLGDVDDGENVAGTGYIWFPRAAVILHDMPDDVAAIRLTIRNGGTEPAPPVGYYTAGVIAMGSVAVFGRPYGFGHRTRHLPNVDVQEMPSGVERIRKRGPRRREVSLRWDDGLITHPTRGTGTSDQIASTSTSTLPVASARDVQWLLEGLDSELDGPARTGVLLPYIPAGTPDVVTHLWQRTRGAIYGRIIDSPTIENIRGTEGVNELIRTGIVWREVV